MPLAMQLPQVAAKWGFRAQRADEPEAEYRQLLAGHIGSHPKRDLVEATEVATGMRWDQFPARKDLR